ncbi:MAG: pilus assembly protein PilP [Gemmatimonadota bacterium]|nr:pilus assembly protein PilP [Gemmatimonadota bacterium]
MTVNRSSLIACVAVAMVVVALAVAATAQTTGARAPVRVAAAPLPKPVAPTVVPPVAPASSSAATSEANPQLISRETYAYQGTGRRDPFVSLMNNGELRPVFQDLKLVAVALDPLGRNSVAVLRDVTSKEQYRVKVGQEIGRMRVAAIRQKSVTFGIEEFGYSRQETLAMNDSTKARTQ